MRSPSHLLWGLQPVPASEASPKVWLSPERRMAMNHGLGAEPELVLGDGLAGDSGDDFHL
jgi:hypothetical protein